MLDVSVSYNRYKYVGCEFLTWLWFLMDKDPARLKALDEDFETLEIGNRVVLETSVADTVENITIKGDDAGLEEGMLALRKGALVTELNLVCKTKDHQWQFTIKGESLSFINFKTPDTGMVETKEDLEGAVLEKVYLFEKVLSLMDDLFCRFLKIRVSDNWNRKSIPAMKKWIYSR
jgi:hypothetical protein